MKQMPEQGVWYSEDEINKIVNIFNDVDANMGSLLNRLSDKDLDKDDLENCVKRLNRSINDLEKELGIYLLR